MATYVKGNGNIIEVYEKDTWKISFRPEQLVAFYRPKDDSFNINNLSIQLAHGVHMEIKCMNEKEFSQFIKDLSSLVNSIEVNVNCKYL